MDAVFIGHTATSLLKSPMVILVGVLGAVAELIGSTHSSPIAFIAGVHPVSFGFGIIASKLEVKHLLLGYDLPCHLLHYHSYYPF